MTYCLTIAGLDPSGHSGILADIKMFQKVGVHGFAVNTATTVQNRGLFVSVHWEKTERVLESIDCLFEEVEISICKIGLIESPKVLETVIKKLLAKNPQIKIVWDPILKTSSGFDFGHFSEENILSIQKQIFLSTPNISEQSILKFTDNYLLKGGHRSKEKGIDILHKGGKKKIFYPKIQTDKEKRGTGCRLSAAIAAFLSLNYNVETAISKAKQEVELYMMI